MRRMLRRVPTMFLGQDVPFLQLQVPIFQRHLLEKNVNANAESKHRPLCLHKLLLHDSQLRNLRLQVHETALKRWHSKKNLGSHLQQLPLQINALPLLHHLRFHLLRLGRLIQLPSLSQLLLYLYKHFLMPDLRCHFFGSRFRAVRVRCCPVSILRYSQ